MAITLNKPLGTDIYDVNVFNQNFTIIEQYLNNFQTDSDNSIYMYYYPEHSSVIDIDNLEPGFHICDDLLVENLKGTYPSDDSKVNFEVLSFGKDGTSKVQLYIDMSYSNNKVYIRSWIQTGSAWTSWKDISSGLSTSSLEVTYVEGTNIDNTENGIYFIENPQGTLPPDITTTNIQITTYGENEKNKTQLLTDLTTNKVYTRVYNTDSNSWSEWTLLGEDTSFSVSVVNL